MSYPDKCLKGIPNPNYIHDLPNRKAISYTLFAFQKRAGMNEWIEESINWVDNKKAIRFTFSQEKAGNLQFKTGVAILYLSNLKNLKKRFSGLFDFERKKEHNNGYHGNLLLNTSVETNKPLKTMIGCLLADDAEILLREDFVQQNGSLNPVGNLWQALAGFFKRKLKV